MTNDDRGTFSRPQVQQLLRPVNPVRVVTGPHVKPHLSQQDVLAHLIRVFGFGHFDIEVREAECLFEEPTTNSGGKPAWNVGYRALVRLTVRDEQQNVVAVYDGGSTGESDGQPSRADSHDLAFKSALSTATKRAAIHLGDQFGLSLYNKGQMSPLVKGTMVETDHRGGDDVQDGVEQQEEDGGAVAERQDAAAEGSQEEPTEAPAPARKTATKGRQGARRKTSTAGTTTPVPMEGAQEPASEPQAAEEPAQAPEPQEDPAEAAEREERARIAAEQEAAARAADEAAARAADEAAEEPVQPTTNLARNADALEGETEPEYQHRKLRERQEAHEREMKLAKEATEATGSSAGVGGFLQEPGTEEPPHPTTEYVDEVTGVAYATDAERTAAIKERVQAKQAAREAEADAARAAQPEVTASVESWGEPEPAPADDWDVAMSEEPENWHRLTAAAANQVQLKTVWDRVTAAQKMTTELRAEIIRRKAELPEA